jgi:predicted TIM-barrel fold metal-dependent hydrolase
MPVVDVDSHFEPRIVDDRDHPLAELSDKLPCPAEIAIEALAGDLWNQTDSETRAQLDARIPMLRVLRGETGVDLEQQMMASTVERPPAADDADARVAWMDAIGIDYALVNPGGAYSGAVVLTKRWLPDPADYQRGVRLCNDYLADWTVGHTDRLAPVTLVDVDDIDWSVGEMERMRERGSRSVFVPATPYGGRSPAHPVNDRLWEAMASLGMIGVLHIGSTPANFTGGWADAGWLLPGGGGAGGYTRFANSARLEAAQKFINAMVFGGVFERVPTATILLSELWAGWLPWFVARFEMLADSGGPLGSMDLSMSPQTYVRRNIKASPLPGMQDDGMNSIHSIPEMLVFSSDFPHTEGNVDPIGIYGNALDELSDDERFAFLGGTMLSVFERTGDPLVLTSS